MCHRLERVQGRQKDQAKRNQTDREHGIVEKELMNSRAAGEMTEARKEAKRAPRAGNEIGTETRTREAMGAKGIGKGKRENRYCYDCGEQGNIGVNCPYKWANSMEESSWESEPEGENAEELASLETHDEEGEWCWPKKGRVTRWRRRTDSRPAVHYLAEEDEDKQVSRGLNHLVPRSAAGTRWTWKKVTVVVDSGAAENVMPRSMFPEMGIRQTEMSKNGKGFKDQEERTSIIMRSKSCPSERLTTSYARVFGRPPTSSRLGTTSSPGRMRRTS